MRSNIYGYRAISQKFSKSRVLLYGCIICVIGILCYARTTRSDIEGKQYEFSRSSADSEGLRRTIVELPNIRFPAWFEPKVLLSNEESAKDIFKSNTDKQTISERNGISKAELRGEEERCTVVYVGCFIRRQVFFDEQVTLQVPRKTSKSCISECSQSKRIYASISAEGECFCGQQIISPTLQIYTDTCEMCRVAGSNLCDNQTTLDVYRIVERCTKEIITTEETRNSITGCFSRSIELTTAFQTNIVDLNFNSVKCLLYCEKRKETLSVWDNLSTCHCGRFYGGFSLHHLGTRMNASYCEKVVCSPGNPICHSRYITLMRTNVDDMRCSTKKFLHPTVARLVALISFPGSGNTWVRYLIETATGIYSGSVYKDKELFQKGFLGEMLPWNSRRTGIIKTHEIRPDLVQRFDEAVLIIRSPFDAIVAEFNRLKGGDHVSYAKESLFRNYEWIHFITYKIEKWLTTCELYSAKKSIFVVFFEDLVADPLREIRKIVDFLHYPIENYTDRLACLESSIGGNFARKKRKLSFDPFPKNLTELINFRIKTAREILLKRSLPLMPKYER